MASRQQSAEDLRRELRNVDGQRRAIEEEIAILSERLNAPGQPGLKGSLLDKEGYPRADIDVTQVRRDRHRLICLTNDHKTLSDKLASLLGQMHAATRSEAKAGGNTPEAEAADAHRAGTGAAAGAASGTSGERAATAAAAARRGSGPAPMQFDASASASAPTNGAAAAGSTGASTSADGSAAGGGATPTPAAAVAGPVLVPFALIDEVSDGSPAALAGLQVGDLMCAFGEVTASHEQGQAQGQGQAPSQEPGAGQRGSAPSGAAAAAAAVGAASVLQRVAGVLAASEGRPVATTVLRCGAPLTLTLVPQRWAGRGLLGCHLQPL